MAQLNGTFDATQVEPAKDQLPAGWYIAHIAASEVKANRTGTGQHLSLEFQIADGQFAGWKIWESLNLWHQNPKASQIAQGKLSAIARAINVLQFNDSNALHGFNMQIRVAHNNEGKAEIKGYKVIEVEGHQPSPGRQFAEQAPTAHQPQTPPAGQQPSPQQPHRNNVSPYAHMNNQQG